MEKETVKTIVKTIEKIIKDGGVVTIDLNSGKYIPAPVKDLNECVNTIEIDKDINMKELLEYLYKSQELEVVKIREDVYIIGKRGTSIVVYRY